MIDDPLSLVLWSSWLMAASMWPVGFLFGACSPCCDDGCQWIINFTRCMRISVVGSNPPDGTHCRIAPTPFSAESAVDTSEEIVAHPGTGDWTERRLSIHNHPAEIVIPVRITLSASGSARTPVGTTRQQAFRFVANQIPLRQETFDPLGPPWHLQVDLTVTGVATQQEASVATTTGTDEYGQPKLVVTVAQWESAIDHTESITLFPVGAQRWEGRRLTNQSQTATLVSGAAVSGWTVTKPAGLQVVRREIGVALFRTGLCYSSAFNGGVLLGDEADAIDFLNGESDVRLPISGGELSITIVPNSRLCEVTDFHAGVALGIYPTQIYRTNPSSPSINFVIYPDATITASALYCAPRPFPGQSNFAYPPGWGPVNKQNFLNATAPRTIAPSEFFSGGDLLWHQEHGPYRTSVTGLQLGSPYTSTDVYSFAASEGATWQFALPPEYACGDYAPSPIPGQGSTITRTCVPPFVRSFTFPKSQSVLPRFFAWPSADILTPSSGITYNANCDIRPLVALQRPLSQVESIPANSCLYFRPDFGFVAKPGDISPAMTVSCGPINSNIPCDDCTLNVEVISGGEFGDATVMRSGDRAGLVRVIAKQQWLSGQGVTLRLTCGSLVSTQSVRVGET